MLGPRIVVVSDSRPIRETLDLLLRDKYEVAVLTLAAADSRRAPSPDPQLIIADSAALRSSTWVRRCQDDLTVPIHTVGEYSPDSPALPFEAASLLRDVAALLNRTSSRVAGDEAQEAIRYPLVPRSVESLAQRARLNRFPVLILGEPGVGKSRLARALHTQNGGRFLMIPPESFDEAGLLRAMGNVPTAPTTLYLSELSCVSSAGRTLLRELVDTGGIASANGWTKVRVIAASVEPIERLETLFHLDPDLFHHLSVITLRLPALRERTADIPAIVHHLSARMGSSRNPARFSSQAMERLQNYLWFGNLAELEAVIARSLMLADRPLVDASDLVFRASRGEPPSEPQLAAATPTSEERVDLDMVLNELAHEFKNPMVVIKTAAQHLERILGEESGRQEMARLTGQAVDRMDRALENLIQFTRFREPEAQDVALNDVLTRCLSTINSDFSERKVMLDYRAPARQVVHVDVLQITYALENLLRVIVRDLGAGATLAIRPMLAHNGFSIEFRAPSRPISKQLALAASDTDTASSQSIGFLFATALVERNGGTIRTAIEEERMIVAVELPAGDEDGVDGDADKETTRLDS